MALFDIDRNSDDRSNPMPVRKDVIPAQSVMAKQTLSTSNVTSGTSNPLQRVQMSNSKISAYNENNIETLSITPSGINLSNGIAKSTSGLSLTNNQIEINDGANIRVLLGMHTTLGEGLFVSKSGNDATTATGNNLVFNTAQDVFKIVKTGSGLLPAVSGSVTSTHWTQVTQTNSYAHGLEYIPMILAYMGDEYGGYTPLPYTSRGQSDGTNSGTMAILSFYCNVDATNVNLTTVLWLNGSSTNSSFSNSANTVKYFLLQETAN